MANDNTPVNVSYLMQQVGMTRQLAAHTMSAITRGLPTGEGRTEGWLRQVSRDALTLAGVEPFAADVIAHYQLWLCIGNISIKNTSVKVDDKEASHQNKNAKENNKNDEGNKNEGTNNGMVDAAILAGGAVVGATQTAAVGAAGLSALGFTSSGVAAGSIAAATQGSAVAAGSWFALLQSAGMTGMIAGPVGAVAGIAAVGLGLGVAGFVVHAKNNHQKGKENSEGDVGENEQDRLFKSFTTIQPKPLSIDFFQAGIPGLASDDAERLMDRLNGIHVLTNRDFLIVSRTTMEEMFGASLTQYLNGIVNFQGKTKMTNLQNHKHNPHQTTLDVFAHSVVHIDTFPFIVADDFASGYAPVICN